MLGKDTTTNTTCAVLFAWFCSETGSPTTLVSDNGPQFTSKLFAHKMKLWNIKHLVSPPYHPASNGAAERAVQLVKDRLKKMNVGSKLIDQHTLSNASHWHNPMGNGSPNQVIKCAKMHC